MKKVGGDKPEIPKKKIEPPKPAAPPPPPTSNTESVDT
jgi:hypothetical protein